MNHANNFLLINHLQCINFNLQFNETREIDAGQKNTEKNNVN